MQKISEWNNEEWEKMKETLALFSDKELEDLVTAMGIRFVGGVESIKDKEHLSRKNQLILVLEEADKDKLKKTVDEIRTK